VSHRVRAPPSGGAKVKKEINMRGKTTWLVFLSAIFNRFLLSSLHDDFQTKDKGTAGH
jgi:hypothetical protein